MFFLDESGPCLMNTLSSMISFCVFGNLLEAIVLIVSCKFVILVRLSCSDKLAPSKCFGDVLISLRVTANGIHSSSKFLAFGELAQSSFFAIYYETARQADLALQLLPIQLFTHLRDCFHQQLPGINLDLRLHG